MNDPLLPRIKLDNELSDVKKIVKEQKASWFTNTIIIAVLSIGILLSMIYFLCVSETDVANSALVLFLVIFQVLFTFGFVTVLRFVHVYKKRTDRDWIIAYKNKHPKPTQEVLNDFDDNEFSLSKTINISTSKLTKLKLLIDNKNKKFIYQQGNALSKIFCFSDIISYEVYENGNSRVQGRAGSALIGGAFFGLGGAIVGSSRSRNINEQCTQLKVLIRLNDFDCPQISIVYIDRVAFDKSSLTYRNMIDNLQEVCSMLEFIINSKTLEQSISHGHDNKVEKTTKEQLQELKELLDEGLITQEDYEMKKKQVLKL